MQSMRYFCYLTVLTAPFFCKILLGDVRKIVVAFTDGKSYSRHSLVSKGKNSLLFKPIQNTAMPV